MRSASQHTFARVPSVDIPRSSFRRDMTYKTTFNAGYLVPFFLDEIIPGDTFNFKLSALARILSPLKYPVMDNIYMDFQFFFVPIRLVYDDYEKFFGSSKGQSGNWEYDDSHLIPQVDISASAGYCQSIFDYMGVPIGKHLKVNALPFRSYNKIIADWYRPSSYELSAPVIKTDSTDDSASIYAVVKRMKRCDYITTGLPSPQRGPGASISLAGSLPVYGDGNAMLLESCYSSAGSQLYSPFNMVYTSKGVDAENRRPSSDRDSLYNVGTNELYTTPSSGTSYGVSNPNANSAGVGLITKSHLASAPNATTSGLYADASQISMVSINDLRMAFQLQRALERDMRGGGARYVEQLMAHFGVRSPDARLQRSEYLGGGTVPINVHTVASTAATQDVSSEGGFVGSLAAFGVGGTSRIGWVKSFTEHGYVIGLMSVRADLTYQQGLPRLFDRRARFDFYYPVFSHLGEQTILNKEIYAQGVDVVDSSGKVVDDQPFAYQERFGEYRFGLSKITGALRSTYSNPLDAWHLAQKFNNLPTLSWQFLQENVPMSRIRSVTDGPDFLFDSLISINCVRPMPLFGVPGLVDHF